MNINSISSSGFALSQTGQSCSQRQSEGTSADSQVQGGRGPGGGMFNALSQAFASLGISLPTGSDSSQWDASSGTTSSEDQAQAISSFMQQLFTALHAQSGASSTDSTDASADSATQSDSVAAAGNRPPPPPPGGPGGMNGGAGRLESDLASLIDKLGSTSSSSTATSSSDTTSTTASTDSTTSSLEQSFQQLLSSLGSSSSSSSSATLSGFLQALAQNLHSSTGNLVNTQA